MTNLFAEYQEEIIKHTRLDALRRYKPILFDINNVRMYVQSLGGGEILSKEQVPDLPIDVSWFEFNGAFGPTGVLACRMDDSWQRYVVFSEAYLNKLGHFYCGMVDINRRFGVWRFDKEIKFNPVFSIVNKSEQETHAKFIVESFMTVVYACTFSHCKNVDYYEKSHPEKLQKANIKRGKKPQETYKVLDIGGLQKQAKSESTSERGELKTALHICRGHFKTYTEENPLFGKHTGTYWWPMHKRGSEDNGKVNKDYKVHPS